MAEVKLLLTTKKVYPPFYEQKKTSTSGFSAETLTQRPRMNSCHWQLVTTQYCIQEHEDCLLMGSDENYISAAGSQKGIKSNPTLDVPSLDLIS